MKKLFFLFALASLTACSKDSSSPPPDPSPIDSPVVPPPKAYSYWKVGNDSFKSNNVEKAIGKVVAGIASRGEPNRFTIGFRFGYLPTHGNFPVAKTGIQHPDSVAVSFYYRSNFYISYGSGFLHRDSGVKFQAILDPTWYVNYDNPLDTVLISGIFREP